MRIADKIFQDSNFSVYSVINFFNNSSQVKIRSFFRSLSRDYGMDIDGITGMKSIPFHLSIAEIAELTSISPQSVERILLDMEDEGLVNFSYDLSLIN